MAAEPPAVLLVPLQPCSLTARHRACPAMLCCWQLPVLLLALLRRAGRAVIVLALTTDLCSCLGKEPDSSVELCGE